MTKKAYRACLDHTKMTVFQGKKKPEPLVTAHEVTQDPNDMEKGDMVGSIIEGTKKTSVCVTPHPSVLNPPPYNNNRDYKGDTQDKTLDSHTPDSDVKKMMMLF